MDRPGSSGTASHPSHPADWVPQTIDDLARAAGVPVLLMRDACHPHALATIAAHQPDVIAVACFPRRLRAALLDLPRLGCLNVHPSLLPLGRGPEPVFWTLRRGERRTGVTIHRMDAGLDTGPISLQEGIAVPEGIRAPDLERHLAGIGGRLLVRAIDDLATGQAVLTAQDDALATTAPVPTGTDFVVPTNLPARWVFNFVRGVAPLDGPLELLVLATGGRFRIGDALDYSSDGVLDGPIILQADEIIARFTPGTVRFSRSVSPGGGRPIDQPGSSTATVNRRVSGSERRCVLRPIGIN